MTSTAAGDGSASNVAHVSRREDGPYVLRPLLDDVPLSEDGSHDDISINCVDYFENNLYVGTSASELLHFFQIPPDPSDKYGKPVYILASRLSPLYSEISGPLPGVQQILLLPKIGKACILCNGTATFYSLPELTPVSGVPQVKNCTWVGGIDLNQSAVNEGGFDGEKGVVLLLSVRRFIRVVRFDDTPRAFQKIEFPNCGLSVRRDSIACVADSRSYALLDIQQQLKIPLMNISSLDEAPTTDVIGQAQNIASDSGDGISRSASAAENRPSPSAQGHSRSTSLGASILSSVRRQGNLEADEAGLASQGHSPPAPSTSPQPPGESSLAPPTDKPLPPAPSEAGTPRSSMDLRPKAPVYLKPHIASPTPEEFLIVMGTNPSEPGLGMFVNLDGETTRSTITFDSYPKQIVVDGNTTDLAASRSGMPGDEDGFVLASLAKDFKGDIRNGLEIQRWDAGSETNPEVHWLEAEDADISKTYGIRVLVGSDQATFDEIVERLSLRKFSPFPGPQDISTHPIKRPDSRTAMSIEQSSKEKELFDRNLDSQDEESLPEEWEATRNSEEEEFAHRLAKVETKLAVWSGNRIWWAIRNPLIVQIDTILNIACATGCSDPQSIDRRRILMALGVIRGRDAKTELEFLTFGYLRQKAGFLLLTSLLLSPASQQFSDGEMHALEEVLMESKLDPRVVLSLVPGVRNEIVQGSRGIWIYGGVKKTVEAFLRSGVFEATAKDAVGSLRPKVLYFLRRFLAWWRKMKGFGSVPDENEVFRTVDAALLLVLLELDQATPHASGSGSVRAELNELVDGGVDCFNRAVDLLQSHHRLFVLSRLYQSRKMARDVLATWRRIIDGERDDIPELRDGENQVRVYLTRLNNQALVKEYGVWLANRNPKLGVQVFTEDKGKSPKFEPAQAVEILRAEAPEAVKYYLEHLVFGKGHTTYVNELIAYYLDIVIGDLESSADSRDAVMAAYDAYRALQAPKPTYRHFLTENAPPDNEVWQSRLRLLQLLGGAHDYDTTTIHDRIASLPGDLLVPETIILAGRKRKHEDALRLLVHKLGDYDTAVSYCLRGGSSIYFTIPDGNRRHSNTSDNNDPAAEEQLRHRLFQVLLREFLVIDDVSDRVEQTGALLERFGGLFDLDDVLSQIPDGWSVDVVAGFLVSALRRLVGERHEAMVKSALSGAENLRVNHELVAVRDEMGPSIEASN